MLNGPTRAQRFGAVAIIWMALISSTSAQPKQRLHFMQHFYDAPHHLLALCSPATRAHGLVGWLEQQNYAHILDKPLHVVAYAVLALLWLQSLRAARRPRLCHNALAWAALLTLVFAVFDEWHQSFTPGREMRASDVLADAVGVLVVAAWARLGAGLRPAPANEK